MATLHNIFNVCLLIDVCLCVILALEALLCTNEGDAACCVCEYVVVCVSLRYQMLLLYRYVQSGGLEGKGKTGGDIIITS